jgi:hypothetical protein
VAGGKRVRHEVERHLHLVAAAGLERARVLVAVAVRQVEEPTRHESGRPVWKDLAEPHGDERARAVGGELQGHLRESEDLERLGERLRVEREGERVVGPLIAREVGGLALRRPDTRLRPAGLDAQQRARTLERQLPDTGAHLRRRPLRLRHPTPRP